MAALLELTEYYSTCSWIFRFLVLPALLIFNIQRLYYFVSNFRRKQLLDGKVVFITGASSGLGEALAHCYYNLGCKVILASRRESELERVKRNLLASNVGNNPTAEAFILCIDLSEIESLDGAVQKVYEKYGHIDVLINNGGISSRGDVLSTAMDVHIKLMNVNYFGPVALTKAVLPKMIQRKGGHIIFISSIQGLIAIPDRSAYAASKHACQAFADSLRSEMDKHNIDVTVVSPGYIKTALSLSALTGSGRQHGVMDANTAAGYKPEAVAESVVEAMLDKKKEVVLAEPGPRLAIFLRFFAPSIYFRIMARRAK